LLCFDQLVYCFFKRKEKGSNPTTMHVKIGGALVVWVLFGCLVVVQSETKIPSDVNQFVLQPPKSSTSVVTVTILYNEDPSSTQAEVASFSNGKLKDSLIDVAFSNGNAVATIQLQENNPTTKPRRTSKSTPSIVASQPAISAGTSLLNCSTLWCICIGAVITGVLSTLKGIPFILFFSLPFPNRYIFPKH